MSKAKHKFCISKDHAFFRITRSGLELFFDRFPNAEFRNFRAWTGAAPRFPWKTFATSRRSSGKFKADIFGKS